MYEEELKELQEWFNDDERCYDTGFNGEEYTISPLDVDDFCDFLAKQEPDLIGFPCMIGTNGIWFKQEDLDKARYL